VRYRPVLLLLGRLLFVISLFMLVPALASWYYDEPLIVQAFLMTAGFGIAAAGALVVLFRKGQHEPIGLREGFLLVTLSWVLSSFLGAIPFYITGTLAGFADAWFEAVSGFTTTGASVLADVESASRGIVLWRGLIQWIGGMGIIVLGVAILPELSIGGIQLMKQEFTGPTFEQIKPRIKETALSLWRVYVLFSLLLFIFLALLGMPFFESLCHMFGTMSTGGFSTRNQSIGAYGNPAIEMTIAFFMFLSGANFVLHYAWLHGDFRKLWRNSEWRFYTGMTLFSILLIFINLAWVVEKSVLESLRLAIFQVITVITTSGFATADFDAWPYLSKGMLFLLMVAGGCAGSTAGGFKQVRLLILFRKTKQSIMQHIYPKAVYPVKIEGRVISDDVIDGVASLFLIFMVTFSISTLFLLGFNIDFVTATSAVITCLSNVGPGFGDVGPVWNYAFLPIPVKLLLSACMIVGRLEFFTVLVLFLPVAWKR